MRAKTRAEIECRYNGTRSPACTLAQADATIALMQWCEASHSANTALCPIPTSTPTTPTLQVQQQQHLPNCYYLPQGYPDDAPCVMQTPTP